MRGRGARQPWLSESGPIVGAYVPLLFPVLLLAGYWALALRQWRHGRAWPPWRAMAWALGCVLVAAAVSPGIMERGHHDLRTHTWQHLLLGMFAPVPLIMARPGTLLLRGIGRGGARRLVRLLHAPPMRLLASPVTALLLNVGALYLLYLTPLYAAVSHDPVLHWLLHLHVLAAGCLFTHVALAQDPSPFRASFGARLAMLLVATGLHATLSKLMYAHALPAGTGQDRAVVLEAAQLMYYGGDAAELLVIVLLFATGRRAWARRAPVKLHTASAVAAPPPRT